MTSTPLFKWVLAKLQMGKQQYKLRVSMVTDKAKAENVNTTHPFHQAHHVYVHFFLSNAGSNQVPL